MRVEVVGQGWTTGAMVPGQEAQPPSPAEEARVSIPQLLSSHHLICCAFYWWNPARSQREDKRASRDAVHSHRPLLVLDKKRRLAKGSVGETETSEYSHMRGKSMSSEDRAES